MCYDKIQFGNRLYAARQLRSLKQEDVSNRLGMTQSAYSKIESGKRNITITQLYKLSSILDVRLSWLLGEDSIDDFTPEEQLKIEEFKQYIKSIRKK